MIHAYILSLIILNVTPLTSIHVQGQTQNITRFDERTEVSPLMYTKVSKLNITSIGFSLMFFKPLRHVIRPNERYVQRVLNQA